MRYLQFVEAEGQLADELRFLARSVSCDETRYYLNYIFLEPSEKEPAKEGDVPRFRGVSTDGRRLHLIDPLSPATQVVGMESGFWRVLKSSGKVWLARCAEEPGSFPNYRKVIPEGDAVHKSKFSGFSLRGSKSADSFVGLTRFFRGFPEATAINLHFLEDLGASVEWDVDWYGPDKGIRFISGQRLAVLMPLHVGE